MDFTKPLLAIFAHPDDESFGCAGTLALFAEHGAPVTILTLTRGEKGASHLKVKMVPEELGLVREGELRQAARILGVREVIVWNYPDGGLADVPEEELVRKIVEVIRSVKPEIIITFEPQGISGHRDHIAASRSATEAYRRSRRHARCYNFDKIASASLNTLTQGSSSTLLESAQHATAISASCNRSCSTGYGGASTLYWRGMPAGAMEKLRPMFASRRRSPHYAFSSEELAGIPDEKLEAIDVSGVKEKRDAAIAAHKSQEGSRFIAWARKVGLGFADTEHFLRYTGFD